VRVRMMGRMRMRVRSMARVGEVAQERRWMQIVLEFDQSSKLKYNWAEITKNKTDVITLNYFVNK
jgi:hypothetical protein